MIGLQQLATAGGTDAPATGLSGRDPGNAIWHARAGIGGLALPSAAERPASATPDAPSAPADTGKLSGRIKQAIDLLRSPLGQHFDDPDFLKAAQRYDSFLNKGEQSAGITKEGLYDFGNKLFARELQTGVGSKLPDGSTITGKRLVAARQDGNNLALELDIAAQKPDGMVFNYVAPVTKNRTHDDADEVLLLPIDKVRDRVRAALYMAKAVAQAGGRDALLEQLMQQAGQQRSTQVQLPAPQAPQAEPAPQMPNIQPSQGGGV